MRKFGHDTIQSIIKRACKEFLEDDSSPDSVSFYYKGHYVEAKFKWLNCRGAWYLSDFSVTYSRCTMIYSVGDDYDMCSAFCL